MYLPIVLSLSALVICFFSFIYLKSYLKRRTGQERILAEMRNEVNNILLSIDETAERDISLIEEREKSLKALLEETEKRLKVYVREMEKQRDAARDYSALSPDAGKVRSGAYQEPGKNRVRENRQEPPPALPDTGSTENNPELSFPLPRFRIGTEAVPPPPPVKEQIRQLAQAGFTAPVIASRLGVSVSEVELAVALLERRDSPTTGT
jgi:hypothetical protein